MSEKNLDDIRQFFSKDIYATGTTGLVIESAEPGHAIVSLHVDERHRNAEGSIMGAVYYTMADFAFAVAANYNYEGPVTVTLSSSVNFLKTPKTDDLKAEARVIKDGRSTSFYEIKITDSSERLVAVVNSSGFRVSG